MIYYDTITTKFGNILTAADEKGILHINFQNKKNCLEIGNNWIADAKKMKPVADQLKAYFAGELYEFDIELAPEGTEFQKKVWNLLCDIPFGKTKSYQEIANATGNPNASRAVGMANALNPVAIVIPCHRVIGKNGKLTGYAGGMELKAGLLKHEAFYCKNKAQLLLDL